MHSVFEERCNGYNDSDVVFNCVHFYCLGSAKICRESTALVMIFRMQMDYVSLILLSFVALAMILFVFWV